MISVDMTAIEELKETAKKAASDSDESLALLLRTFGEMQNDVELATHPEVLLINESLSLAIEALQRGNDRLQSLKNIILSVQDEFGDVENENVNMVKRMEEYLGKLQSFSVDV